MFLLAEGLGGSVVRTADANRGDPLNDRGPENAVLLTMRAKIRSTITRPPAELALEVLAGLAKDVHSLREQLLEGEQQLAGVLADVHPENQRSARNLVHYLALRRRDIRELQLRLARVGLSSLGRSEPHVMVTLDRVLGMLALARGAPVADDGPPPVGFRDGDLILRDHAHRLLGPPRAHRSVRIVVTLPEEAATDAKLVHEFVAAGMDCARINCAHGDINDWGAMAAAVREAAQAHGTECRILVDLGGPKLRTGRIADGSPYVRLKVGDHFELVSTGHLSQPRKGKPRIECAVREIFRDTEPGQAIWFNDGKIGGIIEESADERLLIRVTSAKRRGNKLRPERGINLPDTSLDLPAFGEKDFSDLKNVAAWADAIELSFVQNVSDVEALQAALFDGDAGEVGVVLKIETRLGFERLPSLLLAAMRGHTCGVMIARGDLAVESGFERMAEVQEEILWIAEAAHVPTIWATQVLESLTKKGRASRAEITDAAMSGRAEAVMLNKGPFVIDAIRMLDDILGRMRGHQLKKRALFRALRVSSDLWE